MEKKDIKKNKEEKFELFLDNIALEVIDFLSEKDLEIKKSWDKWKEAGDQAHLKICQDKIRENWNNFAVHGTFNFDYKKNKVELRIKPDTDGGISIGLLKEAGWNMDNVKFIKPGEFLPGYINLDTGFKRGVVGDKESKTAWLDHHGGDITKEILPATRLTYLFLRALHFLGENEALENLTRFVSQIDRAAFPGQEKLFNDSYRMVLGLYKKMNFSQLYDYFKSGKRPDDILNESDLDKWGLTEASKERKKKIENSIKEINRLKDDGFVADTEFGKIIVDIDHKVSLGGEAAMAAGFDGYLLFDQKSESFFVVVKEGDEKYSDLVRLDIPQGIAVKNNMIIRPVSEDKLNISLGKLMEILGANIKKDSKLGKAVNALEIRNNTFSVKPLLSKYKKGNDSYIAPKGIFSLKGFFDKIAIFPLGFKPEGGKNYTVRVKYDSNPGERKGIYILEVLDDNKLNIKNMSIENPDLDQKEDIVVENKKENIVDEKNIEIHETKKEKLERLRYELKNLVLQKEPTKEERVRLQNDIKNLKYDIQKHREDKLEIMKDRPKKPLLKERILKSDEPENKGKLFEELEEMRRKEAKKILKKKMRELTHSGKTKEAAELADKFASKEEIGERTEKIREEIVNLEKEADVFFNIGRKEEAKMAIRKTEDLENQIKNMKAGIFDSRNIEDILGGAENALVEFKKHKNILRDISPLIKPTKKTHYIGHILTGGLLYGINAAYLYFRYRKLRLIENMKYKTAKREYQETKKDLLMKLVQEITKEKSYYVILEKLSFIINNEKDAIKRNVLSDILSVYRKIEAPILSERRKIGFWEHRKILTIAERAFTGASLEKIASLVSSAKKTKLI
ncbi:MAG: hypothetical protein AAB397_00315 [Patescibacteria group bacterium]